MNQRTISTQTTTTCDVSTQIHSNNINFIINDNPHLIHTNPTIQNDCIYNKIMKTHNKKINELGHSVLQWREYDLIYSKISNETINELRNNNLKIPHWLLLRAKNNTYRL